MKEFIEFLDQQEATSPFSPHMFASSCFKVNFSLEKLMSLKMSV